MENVGVIQKIIMFFWNKRGVILNYWKRPKLLIGFKTDVFEFGFPDGGKRAIDMTYISIKNNEKGDVSIVSNSLMLDNNRFPTGGGDLLKWCYDNGARPLTPETHEIMYDHYNAPSNHLNICSGRSTFLIKPGHTKIFPIMLVGAAISNIFSEKKDSNLFVKNGLMSVTLDVNQKVREYGIDRKAAYENYFNFLAKYTAAYPPVIKEIQNHYLTKNSLKPTILKRECEY